MTYETVAERMRQYESLSRTLMSIQSTGQYWAEDLQSELLLESTRRVANSAERLSGLTTWIDLQRYPALLLTYAGGFGMVHAGKEARLIDLWSLSLNHPTQGEDSAARLLNPWSVIDHGLAKKLPTMPGQNLIAPMSDYLISIIRDATRDIAPAQLDYERTFDRFEYLSALVQADLTMREGHSMWYYIGRFSYKSRYERSDVMRRVDSEIESESSKWPLMAAGLFGGDPEKLAQARVEIDTRARSMGF